MVARLLLAALDGPAQAAPQRALAPVLERIRGEFPAVAIDIALYGTPDFAQAPRLTAQEWQAADFDLATFDARVGALAAQSPFTLCLAGEAGRLERPALEILTRCQRLSPRRNDASRGALFDDVLAELRALHDLEKPLVHADYDHALDTWQWALRLCPQAGLALQAAALFHDIERLVSEADARIEHKAKDYQAFKDAHAARGAQIARRALARAGLPHSEIDRTTRLIARHERRRGDPELDLLNDADALSFFSLNSGGFMDYYGLAHTRRKIDYSLARLSSDARLRLADVRLRADIAALTGAAR